MAFDQSTRNRLQKLVSDCRRLLSDEFSIQLQQTYGIDPNSGEVASLNRLAHLSDPDRQTAQLLRDTLAHYLAGEEDDKSHYIAAIDRITREQAFTVLNRLAALLMMEARGLLAAAVVSQGQNSQAFELYKMVAGSALGETGGAYRTFLFSLFDEFAIDLPALFDRHAAQGRLFPREPALLEVLEALNHHEIQPLWVEDETIGWIYQYFNSKEERKAMRDASQAPRNSRELAVRNQFFTPRYVVEFLVDNTLGRLWFNATGGQTELRERCQYLLVKPNEQPQAGVRLRDPRTLKLLDPACGSMHFGLYAFDLFLQLYQEAWDWEQAHGPGSLSVSTQPDAGLLPLCHAYADLESYLRDVPRLIVEHNIYGVDIDPRAAQIASLALWLRAQRAWHDAGVKAQQRPAVGRGHVVAAVAPPAERDLRLQFAGSLDKRDAELFEKTLQLLKGLPEMGVLLQIEKKLPALIRQVYGGVGSGLFAQEELESWQKAEYRLREALNDFALAAKSTYQGRLFTNDALEGLRLIDLVHEEFDVVVMNPPFGEFPADYRDYARRNFSSGGHDILTGFIEAGFGSLRESGILGAITSRTSFFAPTTRKWRENVVLANKINSWIDLGDGVLDDAMVETCLYTLEKSKPSGLSIFASASQKSLSEISESVQGKTSSVDDVFSVDQSEFSSIEGSPFAYWLEPELLSICRKYPSLEESDVSVKVGLQTGDDFRFIRCWWEVPLASGHWIPHAKGGENEPFATDIHLVVNWASQGCEMKAQNSVRLNMYSKTDPSEALPSGLTFPYRTHRFSPAIMPKGTVTGVAGMGVYSSVFDLFSLAAILNSSAFNELIGVRLARREIDPLYQAGTISPTPFPNLNSDDLNVLSESGREIWKNASMRHFFNECSSFFCGYFFSRSGIKETVQYINSQWASRRASVVARFLDSDAVISNAYGIEAGFSKEITERNVGLFYKAFPEEITTGRVEAERLMSYSVSRVVDRQSGVVFDLSEVESIDSGKYVEGGLHRKSLGEGFGTRVDCFSSCEIIKSFRAACGEIYYSSEDVCEEFLSVSGFGSLESYLNDPNGFFSYHLQRYSKSRRKAPIYWPLATPSGSYTLWLYYPSLSSQTLFTAVNDFVDPKLEDVLKEQQTLRDKGLGRSKQEEKRLEELASLKHELADLRDSLLEIAPNYCPSHEDGVQITAAPLWKLFRHKPWQKVLKDTWAKLEKGDYDWAHLSMSYWPQRVREKCVTDKSLAIAHKLEHLYIEPEVAPKKARGRAKKQDV